MNVPDGTDFPRSPRALRVARWFGVEMSPGVRTGGPRGRARHRAPAGAPGGPSEWPARPRPGAVRGSHAGPPAVPLPPRLRLRGGTIVLVTGPSGSGKSSLLRALRSRSHHRRPWLDLAAVPLPDRPVVDVMADALCPALADGSDASDASAASAVADDDANTLAALDALARAGLGEVWTYLRTPAQLSDGQRWRLRLALALAALDRRAPDRPAPERRAHPARPRSAAARGGGRHLSTARSAAAPRASAVLVADEFAALLDRLTARVVARAVRKAVSARPWLCALLATSHDDLAPALAPDVTVTCDFGEWGVGGRQRAVGGGRKRTPSRAPRRT